MNLRLKSILRERTVTSKMNRIKIYATPESAAAFKALCAKNGTSVTAELSAYMRK
ncbi:MAG: hypothetical protein LBP73_03870 [Clostridiales Family XIII bacterium]|nr:hypothetical protein [Clostridiales Family XIII bacterium]